MARKYTMPKEKKPRRERPDTIGRKILRGLMMLMLAVFLIGAVSGSVVGGYFFINVVGTVRGEAVVDLVDFLGHQGRTTIILAYDRDGNLVEYARLHGVENRIWIDMEDMGEPRPGTGMPLIADAFIALEDRRFWEHNGMDWQRFLSAVTRDEFSHGASTITQQLIKNLTGESQVMPIRKFREILAALNMERHNTKIEILEAYLNTLYLGSGAYGILTGAETYFGRSVCELNIAEVAVLAAITQAPAHFNPLRNPDNNRRRQLLTLDNMLEQGMITAQEHYEAVNYELIFTNSPDFVRPEGDELLAQPEQINNYYVDFIIETVIEDLMEVHGMTRSEATRRVYSGGLVIRAAVDMEIQQHMEAVFRERTTWSNLRGREDNPIHAAMAVMDYSGRVVGIVGGAGEKTRNRCLNRAAQSWRQPGSAIKPLTSYGPAIENNDIHWATMTVNRAFPVRGEMWPRNFGDNFGDGRMVTAQIALMRSYNTIPARIINEIVGVRASYDFLDQNFGFARLDPVNDMVLPAMALGAMRHGMSALEMTAAYATMGNGGMFYAPFAYFSVEDAQGNLLLSNDNQRQHRAFSPCTAVVLNEILQTVSISGFGHNNNLTNISRFRTFGKTGTTQEHRDRWFAGGTPYYVAAVWFGYDVPRDMGRMTNPSARIWVEVFNRIHADTERYNPSANFPQTNQAVRRSYCTRTGLIAADSCSARTGWFRTSNIPRTCGGCAAAPEPPAATAPPAAEATTRPPIGNWFDAILGG